MNYALVTGAGSGIGKSIALLLAKKGYNVLLVSKNADKLKHVQQNIISTYNVGCNYLAIDLSNTTAAEQVYNWCVNNSYIVEIIVNNAGYGLSGYFTNYSFEEHEKNIHVNAVFPVALTYLFIPQLKQLPKSYILNIASGAAYQAVPGLTVYAATKSFLVSFSRGLQYELRNSGISVTVASPGATESNFAATANVTSEKAKKLAAKFNLQPQYVAAKSVAAMFAGKTEVVIGWANKLSVFFAWLLPKKWVEKSAADIYGL